MTGKLIDFTGVTRLDIPADRVLQKALEANLKTAVVIGYDREGEFYFASSVADAGTVIWLLECAKKRLLDIAEELHDT